MDEAVKHYLELGRCGRSEEAFFGLVDLVDDPTTELGLAFRKEADPVVRCLMVRVIGERRRPNGLDILEEAIRDDHPDVWKQALDGLVNLASHESIDVLKKRLDELRSADLELTEWVQEAITQIEGHLVTKIEE